MKDTKRRFCWFSFYDHTGIETHLERMAEEGWLLEKIGSFTWHYHRTEPKKVTFSVSYFPRASAFDPGPSEEQETFYDFCAHTGWTLAAASGQMQIFYNERPNPVPIDTDPVMEVDAIHRSAQKSFVLPQLLLLVMGLMNAGTTVFRLAVNLVDTLADPTTLFLVVCWTALLVMTGVNLGGYFLWRRRALRAAAQGEFLATKSHPLLQKVLLAVVLIGLVWWVVSLVTGGSAVLAAAGVIGLAVALVIVGAATGLHRLLKWKQVRAETNRLATYGVCIMLSLVLAALIPIFIFSMNQSGVLELTQDSKEPPLAIADLVGDLADGELDQNVRLTQSPLLATLSVNQYFWVGRDGGDPPPHWLDYTVTQVKVAALYGVCREDLLHQYDRYHRHYSPIDAAPWGAQAAYQAANEDSRPTNNYLLCYPDRIVEIYFDWEPTTEQMAIVAEKLGGQ